MKNTQLRTVHDLQAATESGTQRTQATAANPVQTADQPSCKHVHQAACAGKKKNKKGGAVLLNSFKWGMATL